MDIRPFAGYVYAVADGGDISDLIAPPYDILSGEDKDGLLGRSENNIVAVDMPHVPPKDRGPDEEYERAASLLQQWIESGVLRKTGPAVYAYEQQYAWAGKTHIRRALIGGVRATPFGEDVIPHEHTFAGPKADRLRLTECTRMQMSPIFGFYSDPDRGAAEALFDSCDGTPDLQGTLRGVTERLWIVTDPSVIAEVEMLLRKKPVYIADGHHRYTTAMNYARELRESGQIDADHEANYVMFALVAREDPGLLVLPTHRVVHGLRPEFHVDKLRKNAPEFSWRRCSVEGADLTDADAFLGRYGRHAMAVMGANPAEVWIAQLTDPGAMKREAPDECDPWQALDVAILHKLLIDKALAPWRSDEIFVEYTPDGHQALAACQSGRAQLAVILQGTPIEAVQAVADAGGSMPHKSTYFYPKLATGMVIKPLE